MKKSKLILIAAAMTLLTAGAAAAGAWWWNGRSAGTEAAAAPAPKPSTFRYVTLDKVIVMLRTQEGDPLSHYMAVDLVFKADATQEKAVKEQLPLLRSIAAQALSSYSMDKASALSIDQLASEVNEAYRKRYTADAIEQPFAEALISKFIIE